MASYRLDISYHPNDYMEFFVKYVDSAGSLITWTTATLAVRTGPNIDPLYSISSSSGSIQLGTYVETDSLGVSQTYNTRVIIDAADLPLIDCEWTLVFTDGSGHETTYLAGLWLNGTVPTTFSSGIANVIGPLLVSAQIIGLVGPAGASNDIRAINIGAGEFEVTSTASTPSKDIISNRWAGWSLDGAGTTAEHIAAYVGTIPAAWTNVKVTVVGVNNGAGSGTVALTVWLHNRNDTDTLATTPTALFAGTITAAAQNLLQESVVNANYAVGTGKFKNLRIQRDPSADTLGNDYMILGVLIERV
jgi:hypothetical protein